ncbi:hypothetical protein BGW36DRAFT_433884 [Talaromyces proteolyticus]|uniref:Uncharacterized protein n=1 Tax=Talaromyces proteolyticus TaxID=1131652 RepID=A0AAD4PUA8_9EURO|nr:uncharacterized protein BGW36DRAFT_433884 [Talaromyces proteolyticus]KAH8689120.1 hypothetical protein BGW36DRAFT_433884 [Talaromyces proteolyticus]
MYSATLHPLPPLIQEMLDNPPEELLIHRYTGMKDLEIACEPIAEKLGRHEREEQLMIVTHFPEKYIEDGGDIVRRRVYKSTRKMYFWEHHLLILQFRPCNQYCWVSNILLNFCCKWEFEYKTERGIPRDDLRNGLAMVYSTWPDGYFGQHSARESALTVTPMSGLKKQCGTQSRSSSSFTSPSNDLLLYIPFEG